ncbi:DUF222 domain-containing protein [Parvibaculum sp.]|uniref:HNH endonuclease n=1 Tax=Parvibaculum sp. TaxID=2024848 RepID=UPI003BA88278
MMPADHAATVASQHPLPPADVDRLADEIAAVASHIDAATHRLLTLIRRFDEGSGWATHGALSCAHWLNWRIGLDLGAARERVRVARALGALPVLDDALRRGAVSYSKVRAITRVATLANEATLLEMAQHATASQLEKICRGYRRVLTEQERERPESLADEEQRRFLRVSETDDGMVRIEARLRPEEARVVMQALDVVRRRAWRSGATDVSAETSRHSTRIGEHATKHGPGDAHEPSPALSRADALVAVAESFLSTEAETQAQPGAGAAPVELIVHVDEAALRTDPHRHGAHNDDDGVDTTHGPDPTHLHATLDDGTAIPLATAQRLACDAAVVTISNDEHGNIRTLGRRTRRISSTLRRALRTRDDGCRFPGCTNRLTDAHHVVAWSRGGATHLANLCSLCRRHHRLVHEHGYRIERSAGGELQFFRRDGSPVPAAGMPLPPATTPPRGLPAVDGFTAFPRWDGAPVDYGLAVQALLRPELAVASPG